MSKDLQASVPVKMLTAGTAACWADFVTFPLDTAKVRLQLQGELSSPAATSQQLRHRGLISMIANITRQEGFRALYNGLTAGLQRQMAFSSIRIGLYDIVKDLYSPKASSGGDPAQGLHIMSRIAAGLTTGTIAVLLAHPTDLVKVRFQAASRSPTATGPRYSSTMQAYRTIYVEEGARGLWKGTTTNIGRNAIINVAEVVVYDVVKDALLAHTRIPDDIRLHFSAALIAGFAATIVASPVDVVKTRFMNSSKGQYGGVWDCAFRMARGEGPLAFYKGFVPSFARLVSWNVVMWISYEQLKRVTVRS